MKIRINMTLNKNDLKEFDELIGDVSRSAYVRRLIRNEIKSLKHETP